MVYIPRAGPDPLKQFEKAAGGPDRAPLSAMAPLLFSLCSQDAVVIVIGFQSFSDARFDPINMLGILLGIAGSVMYAVLKL